LIRQDKITFFVSTLESVDCYGNIDYNSHVHDDDFQTPEYVDRIFKRIGVISRFENNTSKILTEYLPVNKHDFLNKALLKFSNDYCLKNSPFCNDCCFGICCDYYNKKNDWLE